VETPTLALVFLDLAADFVVVLDLDTFPFTHFLAYGDALKSPILEDAEAEISLDLQIRYGIDAKPGNPARVPLIGYPMIPVNFAELCMTFQWALSDYRNKLQ
jgi:hypothetical protein